jgi:hypothetical protein
MRTVQEHASSLSRARKDALASTLALAIVSVPLHALAQDAAKRLADTFEQRYPAEQAPSAPAEQSPSPPAEQSPKSPPSEQVPIDTLGLRGSAQQNHVPEANKPQTSRVHQAPAQDSAPDGKNPKVPTHAPATKTKRSPARVVVVARSFLDAGTETLPGERKYLEYAFPRTHTAMDVVTNTGGRVGWHKSPLPGPLFPGAGPW